MKNRKFLATLMAIMVAASLVGCGGSDTSSSSSSGSSSSSSSSSSSTSTSTSSTKDTSASDTKAADTSDDSSAADADEILEEYKSMIDDYNAAVDRMNENVDLFTQEDIDAVSELSSAMDEYTDALNETDVFSDEDIENLREFIDAVYETIDAIDSTIDSGSGETAEVIATVTVINNTGVDIYGLAMSPSNSDDWGDNLLSEVLYDGESAQGDFVFTADTLLWDILIEDSEGTQVVFEEVDFSEADAENAQLELIEDNGTYYANVQ